MRQQTIKKRHRGTAVPDQRGNFEAWPKGQSMARLTQRDRNRIAKQFNMRPRKRLGYRTAEQCYARWTLSVAL